MKNKFYKMFRFCRKLKELVFRIGLAQEELRKTNKEIDAKKYELEKTEDMLRDEQEIFADIYNKQREESKKLDDIICRYQVMYNDYKKIEENLERFRRRTVGMGREDIKFNIPYIDIENWMARTTIIDPKTGNRTTIAELCLVAFMKEKKEEDSIWAELQAAVRESKNQLARTVPEVV